MRVTVAFFLALYPAFALAVECGPQFDFKSIEDLTQGITKSMRRLNQHNVQLIGEIDRQSGGASAALENSRLSILIMGSREMEAKLDAAWTLTHIRDQMLDNTDRMIVNGYLSSSLAFAGRRANELSNQIMTTTATKFTRARITVDAAAARNAVAKVASALASCTVPSTPVR